jgi:hypothetical protein
VKAPKGTKVEFDIDGKKAFLGAPSFDVLNKALGYTLSAMKEPDYISAGELLINSTWIAGDEDLKGSNGEPDLQLCFQAATAFLDFLPCNVEEGGKDYPGKAKYKVTVGDKVCYLAEIDRKTYSSVIGKIAPIMSDPNYLLAGEEVLSKCWVEGDEEIRLYNSEHYLSACFNLAVKYLDFKEIKIKKY